MVISCIESRDIITVFIKFINIFDFFQYLIYLKSIMPKEAKDLIEYFKRT